MNMESQYQNEEINENEISQEGEVIAFEEVSRAWRTEIPHIVGDLVSTGKISHFALNLYYVYRRTAGENGSCWKSFRTLSKECGFSLDSVHKARKELMTPFKELGNQPLIKIKKGDPKKNQTDSVFIIDVWRSNEKKFKKKLTCSPPEQGVRIPNRSPGGGCSPGEHKKEHISKKEPYKNTNMSDEDIGLASFLFESIKKFKPNLRKPNLNKWAKYINLLRVRDKTPVDEIKKAITFLENQQLNNEPYAFVVLSASSLLEKFDAIALKMAKKRPEEIKKDNDKKALDIIKQNKEIANILKNRIQESIRNKFRVSEYHVELNGMILQFTENGFAEQAESMLRKNGML